jgi:hypothetical protein
MGKNEDYNHLVLCCFDGGDEDDKDLWLQITELCRSQPHHTMEYLQSVKLCPKTLTTRYNSLNEYTACTLI